MITLQPLPNFSMLEIKFCEPRMSVDHRKEIIVVKKRLFLKRTGTEHIVVGAPVIDDNGPDRRFVRRSRIKAVHSRIVGIDRITSAQLIFFRRNRLSAHPPRESCPLSSPNALVWPGAPRCNVAVHLERESGTGRKRSLMFLVFRRDLLEPRSILAPI